MVKTKNIKIQDPCIPEMIRTHRNLTQNYVTYELFYGMNLLEANF